VASCSDTTGLLKKNSLLRCVSVSDERDSGKGLVVIVEISEEWVYVVTAVVVVSLVVAATVVESRLIVEVVAVQDASECMASLGTAGMSLIDTKGMSVVGYGSDGNIRHSRRCAERDEW